MFEAGLQGSKNIVLCLTSAKMWVGHGCGVFIAISSNRVVLMEVISGAIKTILVNHSFVYFYGAVMVRNFAGWDIGNNSSFLVVMYLRYMFHHCGKKTHLISSVSGVLPQSCTIVFRVTNFNKVSLFEHVIYSWSGPQCWQCRSTVKCIK